PATNPILHRSIPSGFCCEILSPTNFGRPEVNHYLDISTASNKSALKALPPLMLHFSRSKTAQQKGRPKAPFDLLLHCTLAQVFMESKNSELLLVERSLSKRKSIASMVPIGFRMRRSTYIFFSTWLSVMSSSLRVPEREMSMAGKVRL